MLVTTEEVRDAFADVSEEVRDTFSPARCREIEGHLRDDFDRWLNKIQEAAWDAGHDASHYRTNLNGDFLGTVRNPHREEK